MNATKKKLDPVGVIMEYLRVPLEELGLGNLTALYNAGMLARSICDRYGLAVDFEVVRVSDDRILRRYRHFRADLTAMADVELDHFVLVSETAGREFEWRVMAGYAPGLKTLILIIPPASQPVCRD